MFKKLMDIFDQMTETIMFYIDNATVRLDTRRRTGNSASDSDSVLEKLLLIDRRIAMVMAFDMILAGVDTVNGSIQIHLTHSSEISKAFIANVNKFAATFYRHRRLWSVAYIIWPKIQTNRIDYEPKSWNCYRQNRPN